MASYLDSLDLLLVGVLGLLEAGLLGLLGSLEEDEEDWFDGILGLWTCLIIGGWIWVKPEIWLISGLLGLLGLLDDDDEEEEEDEIGLDLVGLLLLKIEFVSADERDEPSMISHCFFSLLIGY